MKEGTEEARTIIICMTREYMEGSERDPSLKAIEAAMEGLCGKNDIRDCEQCGIEIVVAPGSVELAREQPEAMLVCTNCAVPMLQEAKVDGEELKYGGVT